MRLKIYGKAGLFRNDPALYRSFYDKTEQQVIGKLTVRFGKVKKNRLVFKNREMMDCTDNPEAFYEYLISSGYNKNMRSSGWSLKKKIQKSEYRKCKICNC